MKGTRRVRVKGIIVWKRELGAPVCRPGRRGFRTAHPVWLRWLGGPRPTKKVILVFLFSFRSFSFCVVSFFFTFHNPVFSEKILFFHKYEHF
jgi:hypothetical protein